MPKSRKYHPLGEPVSLAKHCTILYRREYKERQSEGKPVFFQDGTPSRWTVLQGRSHAQASQIGTEEFKNEVGWVEG